MHGNPVTTPILGVISQDSLFGAPAKPGPESWTSPAKAAAVQTLNLSPTRFLKPSVDGGYTWGRGLWGFTEVWNIGMLEGYPGVYRDFWVCIGVDKDIEGIYDGMRRPQEYIQRDMRETPLKIQQIDSPHHHTGDRGLLGG